MIGAQAGIFSQKKPIPTIFRFSRHQSKSKMLIAQSTQQPKRLEGISK